jgi:hypothetical protein
MKAFACLSISTLLTIHAAFAQQLPDGYILQYEQNFSNNKSLTDFRYNVPESWGIYKSNGNFYLQFSGYNKISSQTLLPGNIAILKNRIFGDFVLEASVMPDADTSGNREICVFLGLKDTSKYYYAILNSNNNVHDQGIYLKKNSSVIKLTKNNDIPLTWKENKWHKIRIERNIIKRTIRVFLDDMTVPVMQATDYELVMGYVGFGSLRCPGRIDNIKIWAPTVIPD